MHFLQCSVDVRQVDSERRGGIRNVSGVVRIRQAGDLRVLVARVGEAVAGGALTLESGALEAWLAWASAEADRLDPVLSGQVMSHVLPPSEEPDSEPDFT